jgi:hypothetical protein
VVEDPDVILSPSADPKVLSEAEELKTGSAKDPYDDDF